MDDHSLHDSYRLLQLERDVLSRSPSKTIVNGPPADEHEHNGQQQLEILVQEGTQSPQDRASTVGGYHRFKPANAQLEVVPFVTQIPNGR
jgi:hypothetical protein